MPYLCPEYIVLTFCCDLLYSIRISCRSSPKLSCRLAWNYPAFLLELHRRYEKAMLSAGVATTLLFDLQLNETLSQTNQANVYNFSPYRV